MSEEPIKISGVGCSLLDYIYTNVSFKNPELQARFSTKPGDGGIMPGNLVFSEDLVRYTGEELDEIHQKILPGTESEVVNVGGPCIVAMIHASQLLHGQQAGFCFFGALGNDAAGRRLRELIGRTPVKLDHYEIIEGATPKTIVLSDPDYNEGHGERAFINTIGVAGKYIPARLDQDFFNADVLFYGGTALVPPIHDHLSELLKKGKEKGSINIVTTVFDFRNENLAPDKKWPMGRSEESFQFMDLLIMDQEEALRISGMGKLEDAADFFIRHKTSSFIITCGAGDLLSYSNGSFFTFQELGRMAVLPFHKYKTPGLQCDTTGCGDNFAGGVLSSLITQMNSGKAGGYDLAEACTWGIVSGTYSGLITGGVEFESKEGEKLEKITRLYQDYKAQLEK
ncbi:MAG: carbohydrate kinase family protein [Bacteroidetes bacterium]|nr:carbohydrate kinase family protein [Bacteroidota bacterium]